MSVREAFHAQQANLLALPEREYALAERLAVTAGKTPYVRFDLNDYSVPHTHVRRALTVLADEHRVRVFDGAQELVNHVRSWDRGQQIEQPVHIEARPWSSTSVPPAPIGPAIAWRRPHPPACSFCGSPPSAERS